MSNFTVHDQGNKCVRILWLISVHSERAQLKLGCISSTCHFPSCFPWDRVRVLAAWGTLQDQHPTAVQTASPQAGRMWACAWGPPVQGTLPGMERALGPELLLAGTQSAMCPAGITADLYSPYSSGVWSYISPYKPLIIWQKKHLSIILSLRTVKSKLVLTGQLLGKYFLLHTGNMQF